MPVRISSGARGVWEVGESGVQFSASSYFSVQRIIWEFTFYLIFIRAKQPTEGGGDEGVEANGKECIGRAGGRRA